ncbi:hypothetical protein VTL71DRAFT_6412 [Oculimacula yallundae]|uniref:RRM domain-containing protein n=1 Tax=Oculimacula yallundae TaxID=86028 RepID=A0ABR4BYE4_9HELO
MAAESPRGRVRSRTPLSDVSKGRGESRSASRPRRSITPRSVSRGSRRNGRYRSESRSVSRGRSPSPVRSTKVVIEKLTKNVNEAHLREIFGQYGQIRDLDMPMNRSFNTNRGTAYILYTSEADAEAAIAHMHESQIDGAVINVSIVLPRRKFSPSPPLARRGLNLDPRATFNAAPSARPPPPAGVIVHGLGRFLLVHAPHQEEEEEGEEVVVAEEQARQGMVEGGEAQAIAAIVVMRTEVAAEVGDVEVVADVNVQRFDLQRWITVNTLFINTRQFETYETAPPRLQIFLEQSRTLENDHELISSLHAPRSLISIRKSAIDMGKSQKSDNAVEACPSCDHDTSNVQNLAFNSKKSRAATKSDKSHGSNRSRVDTSRESSATLKPMEPKKSKSASKLRRFGESSKDEGCHDSEHEPLPKVESKESKNSKSAAKLRTSIQSKSMEEPCQHADHDPPVPTEKPAVPKTLLQPANESDECLHTDHGQHANGQKISTTATKPDGVNQVSKVMKTETVAAPRSAKQSSKKVEKIIDKLRRSSYNECCFDSDHEDHPEPSKKVKKEKERLQKKAKKEMKDLEKKEKKVHKQIDKQEKKDKIVIKSDVSNPREDIRVDAEQWLSPSDAKKLKKLMKSRDEKIRKSEEKLKKMQDKMKQTRESETPRFKGKNKSTNVEEHDLRGCDAIHTNDGPSDSSPAQSPAQAFPRGIQIMAKNTNTLEGGFPYPKELAPFGISKADWSVFCLKLTEPLANKKIAYAIEKVLDICAEEDVMFFRPKGFILRLDMPGEEQHGLDMMDIYHTKLGSIHTDNFTTMPRASKLKDHSGAIKHKHHVRERSKDRKHLESLRDKAFRSTRLIIDPIIVLKDPELATKRGWAGWIIASNQAQKLAAEAPPKRMDNKPWYGYFPARWDRWPPSKHLYYDRFRGAFHAMGTKKHPNSCFIPDYDSMDQRGSPYTSSVIPCDEVEFAILHPDQP